MSVSLGGIKSKEGGVKTSFADSAAVDAFARARFSQPVTLFDSQLQYDEASLFWVNKITNTAAETHDPNNSAVDMTTGTDAGDAIIRQTKQYFRYQPGKSQLIMMTFDLADDSANNRYRVGYFDDNNGVFLQRYNGVTSIVLRSKTSGAVVDTVINQSDWNFDKLDGTGVSNISLDITKAQILVIDLEWLSVGRVRVGFFKNGVLRYAHAFNNANVKDGAYMTTANLPVRYSAENVDGGTAADLKAICCSVISEGGFEAERGIPAAVSTGTSYVAITTVARTPILSIRPAPTFNSIENRSTVILEQIKAYARNDTVLFETIYDGTLVSAEFTALSSAYSTVEYDTNASAITGGNAISIDFVPAAAQGQSSTPGAASLGISQRLPFARDVDGNTPTIITITGRLMETGASANTAVALLWDEVR